MRFKTGDLVFAKVRGYPAWPAKVTCADVPGGGERYSVVFYGTDEFANLSAKNLWIYNNVFKNKFATKNHMKKAAFAMAMDEIEKEYSGITLQHGQDVVNEVQKENDTGKLSDEVSGEMKGKANTGKEKKNKVLKQRDGNKDLQEDEANNNKLFREKIVEDGIGFRCRQCMFVSGIKIVAKTHAAQCGKKMQTRRKNLKIYNCIECTETFATKTCLNKHFKNTHFTSSYLCTYCGYKTSTRANFVRHLRIHDKSYTPGFKCDFCDHRARDNWHLDKHMFSHFKDTNCKSLLSPLSNFSSVTVKVSLTEFQMYGVCSSLYEMTIYKGEDVGVGHDVGAGVDDGVDDGVDAGLVDHLLEERSPADQMVACFNQLGLNDSEWADWLDISSIMRLTPFMGFLSWVEYQADDGKEVFKICTEEKADDMLKNIITTNEFIENLFIDVCGAQEHANKTVGSEGQGICEDIILDMVSDVVRDVQVLPKYCCEVCNRGFKDNAHLNEHRARMHQEPTNCMFCNVTFPDKHSASLHQRSCTRSCHYVHCSFQSRHKHTFEKHLRGHEKMLRRFSSF